MKNISNLLFRFTLFLLVFAQLQAASNNLHFSHLSSRDGLSNTTVIDIKQDQHGIMWFATFDGLNKFDGYNFQVYRNNTQDEHSLMNDVLRTLYIDSQGVLWIGCKGGLSEYIDAKDHFNNYSIVARNNKTVQVNAIVELDEAHLLLGTESGLNVFNRISKEFVKHPQFAGIHQAVHSLAIQNNKILIGTIDGLYVYSSTLKLVNTLSNKFDGMVIQAILPQSESKVWIGTEGHGLFVLNMRSGETKQYQHDPADPKSINSNYIRALALDTQFRLWIGSFNALSIKKQGDDSFTNFNYDPYVEGSISQNSIRSIFMDTQGGVWLGSYYGGIDYYHPLKNQFTHLKPHANLASLNDKVISCMAEDEDGLIWIGTNDMGINIYNPKLNSFDYISRQNTKAFISNNIKSFLFSNDKKSIYIGSHGGGLFKLNKTSKQGRQIDFQVDRQIKDVYALSYGIDDEIWVGTLSGLFRYNEQTETMIKHDLQQMESEHITYLKRDSKDRMWIGGDNSLGICDLQANQFSVFNSIDYNGSLVNSSVNAVYEDSKKRIWIASRGGLSLFDEKTNSFKIYDKSKGLPNNSVYGVLEDSYGRLWLSTNEGISCFTPETETFKNYTESDGLLFLQYTMYSFCQLKSGMMCFGGIEGITMFYPELLIENPHTPAPGISKLIVQNREIHPFDDTGILQNNILQTKEIKLKPSQSNFTIEFFVSNYLAGKHNTFAYQLKNFDNNWYYTSDKREVTYNNLESGTYVFQIKAANNDGRWNETPLSLKIVVLPHWWKTWWAILLFFIIGLFFLRFVWKFYYHRKIMDERLRVERLEKEKIEEVNQMKLRFFINLSHEFRTPLTLIISPLQDVIEKTTDKWQLNQLTHIQKSTNKMLRLVNQLMDYRRAELGFFEIKVQRYHPREQISEIHSLFDKLAKRQRINYKLEDLTSNKEFLIDSSYLELILNNLLSNAFKFTAEGGNITVRLDEDVNCFILEVEDDGSGIPDDKLSLIFDRFYQIDTENLGTGIGLSLVKKLVDSHHGRIEVQSKLGEGTKFSVYFPQMEDVYDASEFADETDDIVVKSKASHLDFIIEEKSKEAQKEKTETISDTILIVEDNKDVTAYLLERLSQSYHVLTANDGLEGLEVLKEHEVDLILTDVMMPNMDGIKFCRTLKQQIKTCHIPIIMLSAKSTTEDQLVGLEVGADDYLPKPFTYSVLKVKIQNMLKSRRRSQEHYSKSMEVEPEKITFNAMDEELLKKAVGIVMDNLDNAEFSTDVFCREMGMSRSNLHLKLKAITGESTVDFIKKIRFNEATKLLLDGRYNVAEVSTMVGFNTPSYFTTDFKKYFGILPTEYVKSRRL